MKSYDVDATRVAYAPSSDVLYVSLGDYDPTLIDEEIDTGDGVFLQYSWPDHELAFIEVLGFAKRFGPLPATINLSEPEAMVFRVPREPTIV